MKLLTKTDAEDGDKCTPCKPHWGWMVVLASYVATFISLGINFSSGLYYVEWMEHFGASSAVTSWIGSLQIGLLCLPGPLGSYLAERFGDRKIVIISGLIACMGLIASAFINNIYGMMVTYGIVTGFGFCLTFTNVATAPMYFFPTESAGLAVGIALSGGGCGTFIMPLLIEYLINRFGWEGSLLILGGLSLNICICGALLRPPSGTSKERTYERKRSTCNIKVLKNSNLVLFLIHQILFTAALSVVLIHITAVIETITGVTRSKSSLALTVIGITNFIGRIAHGAIGGLKSVNVISHYLTSYLIIGCALLIFPSMTYYPVLLFISGVFGFLSAPYASLTQLIIVEYAGIENLKFVYGLFLFNCGIGLVIGAPIAGLLYDETNYYGTSMYFSGASTIACVMLMIKPWIQGTCLKSRYINEIKLNVNDVEKHLVDPDNGFVT